MSDGIPTLPIKLRISTEATRLAEKIWRSRGFPWGCLLLLVATGVARIAATYGVFNQVYDEPAHLASGIEYFQTGAFQFTPDHASLPRVAIGLAPYLAGLRLTGKTDVFAEGTAILHTGDYDRNLTLARVSILPFFALVSILLWLWTRLAFGLTAAFAATLLFTTLPPVLAHAGVATTDMAFTAGLFAAVYGFTRWIEQPDWKRGLFLGLGVALAATTKYSVLLFLPICVAVIFLLSRTDAGVRSAPPRKRLASFGVAALLAFLDVWALYRFSFGPVYHGGVPIPAFEWLRGILITREHLQGGHPSYLLGEVRGGGWWYFFPVVLAVKTPLAFAGLVLAGLPRAFGKPPAWQRRVPFCCATALLLACLMSTINLGVRHVLPLYPFLAMTAGAGAAVLIESRKRVAVAAGLALLVWHLVSSAAAHPDYLAYFNELAGGHPERILAESDIDWGQDVKRLSIAARALHVPEIHIAYFGTADLNRYGLPPWKPLEFYRPVTGWVAISVERLMLASQAVAVVNHRSEGGYAWLLAHQPVARAGKSIWIYYIQPEP